MTTTTIHQDVERIRAIYEDGATTDSEKRELVKELFSEKRELVKELFSKYDDEDYCQRLVEAAAPIYLDAISDHGEPGTIHSDVFLAVVQAFIDWQEWGALTSNVYVWTDITGNVEVTHDHLHKQNDPWLYKQGYMLIHTWRAGFPDSGLADMTLREAIRERERREQLAEDDEEYELERLEDIFSEMLTEAITMHGCPYGCRIDIMERFETN